MTTLEEKITLIKNSKDSVVAALNAYLDRIYNLTDPFFKNNELVDVSNINEILNKNGEEVGDTKNFLDFIKSFRNSTNDFENVRKKILSDDFNLSAKDISYVEIAFTYTGTVFNRKIKELQEAINLNNEILKKLSDVIKT